VSLYRKVGHNRQWDERTDEDGMRYFIGQILTIDDDYGPVALGTVLAHLPRHREAHPEDVIVALKRNSRAHASKGASMTSPRYPALPTPK